MRRVVAAVVVAAVVAGVVTLTAQSTAPPARDISGFWELSIDGMNVPAASLAPGVTQAVLDTQAKKDAHAVRWCNILGLQHAMGSSRPIDIRQGARMIVIATEVNAATRYLYLDRRTHINQEEFDPTTNGDSIARWEANVLVVDTVGFDANKGITAIPGGGFRTAASHLLERYRLLNNGSILAVTFTWEDPKVFRTPHTYEFRYHRLSREYEPRPPAPCDPFDQERARFLTSPPQIPR
jgi:hypothetical protein